jgi:hypothetical protein
MILYMYVCGYFQMLIGIAMEASTFFCCIVAEWNALGQFKLLSERYWTRKLLKERHSKTIIQR